MGAAGATGARVAAAIGTGPAVLWVFEDNRRAQAFYRAHGFEVDGRRELDPDTGLWMLRFARA